MKNNEKFSPEKTESQTEELLAKLENGIRETMESEHYKAFLKVQSHFHGYSYNNTMLIYLQRPEATRVAGFNTWKKLDRYVMKGEKGISILAPNTYKYETLVNKVDPVTKAPVRDPITGEILTVKSESKCLTFRPVTVFDVNQTAGKELPSICNELEGNSINAETIIKAIEKISSVPIVKIDIGGEVKGYYNRSENIIAIQEGMSLDQTAKTLIHEYAHSQLHNTKESAALDKATKEVQAESVAFLVSEKYGVDTSEYSFDYLASWSSDKELKELKKCFEVIQKTANDTIEKMESSLTNNMEVNKVPTKDVEMPECKKQIDGEQDKTAIDYLSTKEKIIFQYSKEFSASKYISENTAKAINDLNNNRENPYSIKEIKQMYKQAGKTYEVSLSEVDKEAFLNLQSIVEDIKKAQVQEKKIKAPEKENLKQFINNMEMEII